ncbi:PDZ domain-containing protein [Blastococcus sp. CT_GayMR20]|uniref:S1C family serine protease n=1 Tax=Blastococcus sp. CT_GayMR20 TaxID=2559609 RepID=UPI0010732EC0|nr:trypsin-like peptidase domain-containing protein [Blastococcus sp. CT_GayMR20]TFV71552.1 PDZ domain-containing protein [Blastococcus sp. CT_GayMR20]
MSEHGYGPGAERGPSDTNPGGNPPEHGSAEPATGATTARPEASSSPSPPGTDPYARPTGQQYAWAPPQAPAAPTYPGYGGHPGLAQEVAPAAVAPAPRRAGRLRLGVAGLVVGALVGGGAGAGVVTLLDDPATVGGSSAAAQSVVIQNPESATTATAAAAKAAPSVVTIYVASSNSSGSGSGVVLTDDGYVLTNNHVVAEAGDGGAVQVRTSDGTLYDASLVGTDPASDLAVVRLDGAEGLTPATFADSSEVQVGDVAVAIGAPLGLSNTVTDGIISATNRAVALGSTADDATAIDALQTDAAINPGNSGGALVNGAGEVIGINTAIATVASGVPGGQSQSGNIGVGFAIPGNHAQRIAEEIIQDGSATRAFLGVSARTAADDRNPDVGTGAEVVTVEPGSAAADAGIQAGDVITAVDDRPVTTSTELTAAVRSNAPGDEVGLTVRRGADTRTAEVTLGSTS